MPRNRKRADDYSADWSTISDRMQTIFETLTGDTHGATTITVDYAAAHRVMKYCRSVAAGAKEDETSDGPWSEMVSFLFRHNQDLDWVMFGRPTILTLAQNTSSQRRPRLRVV